MADTDGERYATIPDSLIERHGRELGPSGLMVYALLSKHARQGGDCYPSMTRIAALIGVSRLTVLRHLKQLEALGYLTVERRPGVRNHYHLRGGRYGTPPSAPQPVSPEIPVEAATCISRDTPPVSVVIHPLYHHVTSNQKKEPEPITNPPSPPRGAARVVALPPAEFLAAWNAIPQFVHARSLDGKRQRHFQARARSPAWLADWRTALAKAAALGFCQGRNDRGWRATVDWFLRPDTVTKILEGCYDGLGGKGPPPKPAEGEQARAARVLAERQRALAESDRARATVSPEVRAIIAQLAGRKPEANGKGGAK